MITPPPIEQPPRRPATGGLGDPTISAGCGDPNRDGERFGSVAGILASATIHLLLLLILALVAHTSQRRSQIVMEVQTPEFESETVSFESLDFSDLDLLEPATSTEDLAAHPIATVDEIVEVGITPPDFHVRAVSRSVESESDRKSPQQKKEASKKKEGVKFFGTHAYGNDFVYVLDASGSMNAGSGSRMQRARAELIRSINELQPHQSFYVVAYNNRAFNMFDEIVRARLRPATAENKRVAARWISSIRPMGGTMPADALKIAGDLLPDAVFFLSDGDFIYGTERGVAMDRFLRGFRSARPSALQGHPMGSSLFPKSVLDQYAPEIVVHTIAFESESSREMMEMIAESKGGQHRFIKAPKKQNAPRRRAAIR